MDLRDGARALGAGACRVGEDGLHLILGAGVEELVALLGDLEVVVRHAVAAVEFDREQRGDREAAYEVFAFLDPDGSGTIDFNEFLRFHSLYIGASLAELARARARQLDGLPLK